MAECHGCGWTVAARSLVDIGGTLYCIDTKACTKRQDQFEWESQ